MAMSPSAAQPELSCGTCNSTFQRREHYQRHLRTHTKEKPFTCSECGQSFGRVDSLARHHTAIHLHADKQDSASNGDRQGERRRVAQACKPCSSSKVRCNGERPCQRCHRHHYECYYDPLSKRKSSSDSVSDKASDKRLKNAHLSPQSPPTTVHRENSNSYDTIQVVNEIPPSRFPFQEPEAETEAEAQEAGQGQQEDQLADQPSHLSAVAAPLASIPEFETFQPDALLEMGDILAGFDPSGPMSTPSLLFKDMFDTDNWLIKPSLLQYEPGFESINDFWLESLDFRPPQAIAPITPVSDMDPSAVAELYSRSHSPAIDKDAVEPRQYHPVSIEVDAQLVFPDLSDLSVEDIDQENLAHVDEVPDGVGEKVSQYALRMQHGPNYPRFVHLRIPPTPVLNAWVQLYFEFFHPVFPILHKPSFSGSRTHWLLIFTVAAIGAHFSGLKDAHTCSNAMHELIRRQTSTMCEQQNQNGRELWMTQIILLNNLGLAYAGNRRTLEVAEILQSVPVTLGRRKRLFTDMFPMQKFSRLQLPLSQKWQIWLLDEERRRTGFAIWLLDSSFKSNFDLSRLMTLSELQISLPQLDGRWGASTAQSWASYPTTLGPGDSSTMERVIIENGWKTAWIKTNTIGKQVMLQHLSDVINDEAAGHPGMPRFSNDEKMLAEASLRALLAMTENEQLEQPIDELKAATTHQLMALTALMIHNAPNCSLTPIVVSFIYGKTEDESLAHMAKQWRDAAGQGRLACFHAARVLQAVKSNNCTHFGTPVSLLKAVFILWIYSMLADRFQVGFLSPQPAPTVVLGPKALAGMERTDWIESGWSRVKLPGISNLLCSEGRRKLLDESVILMRSLRAWGISSTYAHLLTRLRDSQTSVSAGNA
ncbi:hypothetical protein EDB81DRAFT_805187 [Dactylonectria macrodidyma]|uniref:Uncharacterized protein n=1 Tax=Dactylonectria macrodidyma TaxID=307937 RepID=A0A9P9E7A5_9HYPO|nr:hypothetical protein EDB81DRAFT_805187 [Dactylonectria macrodidyma]